MHSQAHAEITLQHVLQDSSFIGNSAGNSQGGALVVSGGSTSTLTNNTFQSNLAARGAGIYIANSSLVVQASNFSLNAARSAGEHICLLCYCHVERTATVY